MSTNTNAKVYAAGTAVVAGAALGLLLWRRSAPAKPQAEAPAPAADGGASKTVNVKSVRWDSGKGALVLLDQRDLPSKVGYKTLTTVAAVGDAIHKMIVRGAPAIGAAGAYGMVIAARAAKDPEKLLAEIEQAKVTLDSARPTAVNLSWATARMLEVANIVAQKFQGKKSELISFVAASLLSEANALAEEDIEINRRLGKYGAELIPQKANLIHHCNTGHLATVQYGTALGIIYASVEAGKDIHVWVDETRPRLQGARLSAWELMQCGVPLHLIADSVAGHLLSKGKVDAVVFGADRVSANGDVANKIGTYSLSVVARENKVPVYAAVPISTIDLETPDGDNIVIEERNAEEVTEIRGVRIAPLNVPVYNPAFDVTPARYLTAIVTEEGVCYPPFEKSLAEAKKRGEERLSKERQARIDKYLGLTQ